MCIVFSRDLKRQAHVDYIGSKASQKLHLLTLFRWAGVVWRDHVHISVTLLRPVRFGILGSDKTSLDN